MAWSRYVHIHGAGCVRVWAAVPKQQHIRSHKVHTILHVWKACGRPQVFRKSVWSHVSLGHSRPQADFDTGPPRVRNHCCVSETNPSLEKQNVSFEKRKHHLGNYSFVSKTKASFQKRELRFRNKTFASKTKPSLQKLNKYDQALFYLYIFHMLHWRITSLLHSFIAPLLHSATSSLPCCANRYCPIATMAYCFIHSIIQQLLYSFIAQLPLCFITSLTWKSIALYMFF